MRNAESPPQHATGAVKRSRLVLGSADLRDDSLTQGLLDQYYDAGGRSLDTANVYAAGESQRAVGKWLGARGEVSRCMPRVAIRRTADQNF